MELRVRPRLRFEEARERFDRPERLTDCSGVIDGAERTWKEYVPECYDGSKAFPLVLTLHGGRSGAKRDNHHAELSTAWAQVAEREGFIVLYPQSLTPQSAWSAWEDFSNKERSKDIKDDLVYIDLLIKQTIEKYNIDESRIYLHGQSFGDVMASYYLVQRPGNCFAAAALMSGPVGATRYFSPDGDCLFGKEHAIPVVRTHGSADLAMPMGVYEHLDDEVPTYDHMRGMKDAGATRDEIVREKYILQNIPTNELWKSVNGANGQVELSVRGRYNAVTYKGNYDFHFYTVEGGGHGPSMDMADFVWSDFFSAWRKEGGKSVKGQPSRGFTPDKGAVVLADGAAKALVDNKTVELSCRTVYKDGTAYVSAEDISLLYPQLSVVLEDNGLSAVISDGSHRMQLSACNKTYVWDDHFCHGARTLYEDGVLLLPVATIAARFAGHKEKKGYDVSYFSQADGQITYDFAFIIRQMLGTEDIITTKQLYEREAAILAKAPQPGK